MEACSFPQWVFEVQVGLKEPLQLPVGLKGGALDLGVSAHQYKEEPASPE